MSKKQTRTTNPNELPANPYERGSTATTHVDDGTRTRANRAGKVHLPFLAGGGVVWWVKRLQGR